MRLATDTIGIVSFEIFEGIERHKRRCDSDWRSIGPDRQDRCQKEIFAFYVERRKGRWYEVRRIGHFLSERLGVIRESATDTCGGESLTTAKLNKICRGNLDEQREKPSEGAVNGAELGIYSTQWQGPLRAYKCFRKRIYSRGRLYQYSRPVWNFSKLTVELIWI